MNKDQIIKLLEDGAYLNAATYQFFHPSFRKGFRKLSSSNISWLAVERVHGVGGTNRLTTEYPIYRLNQQ